MMDVTIDIDFYQQRTEEFVPKYDKCFSCGRECMKKFSEIAVNLRLNDSYEI